MKRLARMFAVISAAASACAAHSAFAEPKQWEPEIQAYELQDRISAPPTGQIVAAGSSSIVLWKTISSDLSPLTVIPRGFGGSTAADLDYFLDRIVLKYAPRAVIIYEGDNDIRAGLAPAVIAGTMQNILRRISERLPDTRVYVIAVKLSPLRIAAGQADQVRQVNQLYAELCASDARYSFIDIMSPMLGVDGVPVDANFRADGLHLSAAGYELWAAAVRKTVIPQQQQPAPADTTPPTMPGSLTATALSQSEVQLRWNASSDAGVGLAGYRIWRDGLPIATTTSTSFTDTGLHQNTSYTYNVSAYDRTELPTNESLLSNVAFVTTPVAQKAAEVFTAGPSAPANAAAASDAGADNATGGGGAVAWIDLGVLLLLTFRRRRAALTS